MYRLYKFFVMLIAVSAILCAGCRKTDNEKHSHSTKTSIVQNIKVAPKTIDPQLQNTAPASQVDALCMEGLLRQGKMSGEICPAGATKWNVSKDGTIWTFYLRKNAKWSNGDSVIAHDYYFGLKRLLMPETNSLDATLVYCIKNAAEYNLGVTKDFNRVGIKILSKHIIQITLETPVPYFDEILTSCPTFPVNEKFYNKVQKNYAQNKNSLLYNGPYIIKEWKNNNKFVFEKNPYYWNKKNITIDNITLLAIQDHKTALKMFNKGEVDITPISGLQLTNLRDKSNIYTNTDSVWFLKFNEKNKFFKNKNIRKAIALAIDRKIFCEQIRKDGSQPAYAFVPPGINGGKNEGKPVTFRERYGEKCFQESAEQANLLFDKGLKELNLKRPITLNLLLDNGDDSIRDGEFIKKELKNKLDINIKLQPMPFKDRIEKNKTMDYEFCLFGWLPDYNDPSTFTNMWVTEGGNNNTGFNNIQYDYYMNIADSNYNNDKRMNAMDKAEKILMDKMVIAPLYYRTTNYIVKPYIKNFVIRNLGVKTSLLWVKNLK